MEALEFYSDLQRQDVLAASEFAAAGGNEGEVPVAKPSMRLLLDDNLSPRLAEILGRSGHSGPYLLGYVHSQSTVGELRGM